MGKSLAEHASLLSVNQGLCLYETPLFARDLLKNDEEIPSVSASIDELQTAIN